MGANARQPNARLIAIVSLALSTIACTHIEEPDGWLQACEKETGRFVYERPVAEGLSDPESIGHGVTSLILNTGAAWVEDSFTQNPRSEPWGWRINAPGEGRYALRLNRQSEPECATLLETFGFNPVTLERVNWPDGKGRLSAGPLDAACLTPEKLGPPVESKFSFPWNAETKTYDGFLEQYSARYTMKKKIVAHPGFDKDARVYRVGFAILDSQTKHIVAEERNLKYQTGQYFRPSVSCGPMAELFSNWHTPVFTTNQSPDQIKAEAP